MESAYTINLTFWFSITLGDRKNVTFIQNAKTTIAFLLFWPLQLGEVVVGEDEEVTLIEVLTMYLGLLLEVAWLAILYVLLLGVIT